MKKFYITTPIYYVNDSPHIGHAYTTLAADVIARFMRMDGLDVHFLTGTDEHGQKIEKSAIAAGVDPQKFTDEVSERFRDLTKVLDISNDDFIRTSESRHKDVVKEIWTKMISNGSIYLDKYAGWYSVRDEAFYDESEIIDGKAPTGAPVEWVEEPSYFFKLSEYQDKLLKFYEDHPEFIAPESRRNEVLSFVKSGLKDLSVSRTSFKWGIPVPNDEEHVMYVWLDALFNYYSAVKTNNLNHFWPTDLHLVGKDILRFHAVYWPAFLMAAELPLPSRVFAHGWWTIEGEKMSKSLGNVISPNELVNSYGVDYTRYFLMREIPFGNDGNFSKESLAMRINSELCNNIGNLAQRVLAFIQKNCEGILLIGSPETDEDIALIENGYKLIEKIRAHIKVQAIHLAIEEIIKYASSANEYVDRNAPWNLKKTDEERMKTVLFTLTEVIRVIAIMLKPFVPSSSNKMLENLGITSNSFEDLSDLKRIKAGTALPTPQIIFPRIQ